MRRLPVLVLLVLGAVPVQAQSGRQALTAGTERYLLADYHGAVSLLSKGLDPRAGPPDQVWRRGVERLADVLLELRQDPLAATWLRWAARLAPQFDVDEEIAPPAVVRAAQAARAFVDATPHDRFVARTEFEWPAAFRAGAAGTVRLAPANIPITARIGPDQFLRGGESRRLPAGSYDVVVSAPGYLPTRLAVELLPGVTTTVAVSLLPETAGLLYVVARPWGTLFVDGQRIGYTSVAAHRVTPGRHVLRLERAPGSPIDTTIVIGDRQQVRLSWVMQGDRTGDTRLDSAGAALDAGDTERGVWLLRQLLSAQQVLAAPARTTALARLAEATWSLGLEDSARAYLRELVRTDPFFTHPSDLYNPEVQAAYARVRRETPAIGIRAPRDTVIAASRDTLPIEIAVGQPGDVRLLLRLTTPRPRDSLLTVLSVDSVAIARISLTAPDGTLLVAGSYAIEGEVALSGGRGSASDLLELTIERLPVDTLPHEPPIPGASYRPETKRRGPSLRTMLEGIGLGALAMIVPVVVNDGDVSGRSIPPAAGVLGGSVALATIAVKRPSVRVPDNIRYNESLRARWGEHDRSIAAENAARLRLAPLRIRTTQEP